MRVRNACPDEWTRLSKALAGAKPQFVRRQSLPAATIAWSQDQLPLVLVSDDVHERLSHRLRQLMIDRLLAPIRGGVTEGR